MEIVPIANKFGYFNHLKFFGDIIDSRQSQINLFIYLLFSVDKLQKGKYYHHPIPCQSWTLLFNNKKLCEKPLRKTKPSSPQKFWTPLSIENPYMANSSPFISFFAPKNSWEKVISSYLEDCEKTIQVFSYKQQLYKQHNQS